MNKKQLKILDKALMRNGVYCWFCYRIYFNSFYDGSKGEINNA